MPGTKPPPSIRAFFQVYDSAASGAFGLPSAASTGGLPATRPAASASTAVRMRVLRTVGVLPREAMWEEIGAEEIGAGGNGAGGNGGGGDRCGWRSVRVETVRVETVG